MRNWYLIPLAALVGLVAGSWGPREDLKRFREQVRTSQTAKKASSGLDAFARLANIPDIASKAKRPTAKPPQAVTNAPAPATAAAKDRPKPPAMQRLSREDLGVRIEEAAELWNTRVELAKTQWKAKLGISGEKASADFETAISAMNETLHETLQALADELERAGAMTPELGLRVMGDLSRTMAETYDAIGAALPEERRGEVSELPVFEFIDPMVAEPLVGVQDKLDDSLGRNRLKGNRR